MIKAKYNAVIVKPERVDVSNTSRIIKPELGDDTNKTGRVIDVGPGHNVAGVGFVPTETRVGEMVVLPTMGFTRFEYDGEEYWVGPENQILATIEEK